MYIHVYMTEEANRVGRECIGFRVRMLNRMITAIYDEALADVGLKTSQFNLLVVAVNREETRPAELAKFLEMDESTMSRNVERMCAKGWLRLEAGDDRRSHRIKVTEKGMGLIRKGYPAWQKAQEEVSRRLGSDSIAALKSVLRKLRG
jgi:DNA-binding MarR family transcriptional regulator